MNVSRVPRGWGLSLLTVAAVGILVATLGQTRASTQAGKASGRAVLFASAGNELTRYDVDVNAATLTKRESMMLPGFITEATMHPSKQYTYIVWGKFVPGDPGGFQIHGQPHDQGMSAFRVDPATGALTAHGPSVSLGHSPGYISAVTTDVPGNYVLAADSDPSRISVHTLLPDGTIGKEIVSPGKLDFGIHAHQVRMDPSGQTVILPCRGDSANGKELAGSLKLFAFKDGILTERQSIGAGDDFHFNARHMDFHPSGKWDYFTTEAQNKLLVYERMQNGSLGKQLYAANTLSEPGNVRPGQIAGTVHVHPNGRIVYVANRASGTTMVDGKRVFVGGENTIAVFSINQSTGEPTLIQNIDTRGIHARTFTIDPTSRMLVAGNTQRLPVKVGNTYRDLPAGMATYHIAADGKLEFVRKYDVPEGTTQMFWIGFVPLP
jgi:6-phosphogluconolactonase